MLKHSILILTFTLGACSSSSNPADISLPTDDADGATIDAGVVAGSEDGLVIDTDDVDDTDNVSVVITGDGQIETINNDRKTDIVMNGSNNTINIESDIDTLVVNGSNSIFRFSANVTVDTCSIIGNDNTAERAENVTLSCLVQGSGNSGFE